MTLERSTATRVFMDTFVNVEVLADCTRSQEVDEAIATAFDWFAVVERTCGRFDPGSELRRLCCHSGKWTAVSPMLFAAISFATELAERTEGAFDPTVGAAMEAAGFDRDYRTGERTGHGEPAGATWRDITLDARTSSLRLERPMTLDLGSVAKGLAIDLAAAEFARFHGFVIDAGGDIFAGGTDADGLPWPVAVKHPRTADRTGYTVSLSNQAICTSGDYERSGRDGHHIRDPRSGASAARVASVSVIAPTAMAADALATAVFVLGPEKGIELLEEEGLAGVLFTDTMERITTEGLEGEPR